MKKKGMISLHRSRFYFHSMYEKQKKGRYRKEYSYNGGSLLSVARYFKSVYDVRKGENDDS